ncbi:MAG: hypothetical protein GF317_04330 [Candidatus Lokiarchaeota archaeon]|nr:hypothetical protein [Candidatus Lokiarchaeota archaeon]MBD3199116.1 hypothetical protein [Candidatus Lokiarchaeota archaeon]
MVDFLILLEEIVSYNKKMIDSGLTPPKIYELCCCIREAFCLSYAIRKENNLYLYSSNNQLLVKFNGYKLKYLGSDERSQALLLFKAINKIKNITNSQISNWLISTPGILVKKIDSRIDSLIASLSLDIDDYRIVIDSNKLNQTDKSVLLEDYEFRLTDKNSLFIISTFNISKHNTAYHSSLKNNLNNLLILTSNNITKPQDQILYINYKLDSLKNDFKKL